MLAKCIFDGLIAEVPLASFFLSQLTGNNVPSNLFIYYLFFFFINIVNPVNQLRFFDSKLADSLRQLLKIKNVEDLELFFAVEEEGIFFVCYLY